MADPSSSRAGGVAVIGLACRVPGADSIDEFWDNLVHGVESIRRFTREELIDAGVDPEEAADPAYVPAKGVLNDADCFDAALFGYTPREAALLDPQHRVMLECAAAAMEHGGHGARVPGARVAVYAGVALNTYLLRNLFPHRDLLASEGEHQLLICNDKDFVPTRISYQLNLAGPSVNVQSACSTSLVAVHMACQALLTHQCDMALAGGGAVTVPLHHGYVHREGGILSADGHCRAFDARAGGTVPGNGAGMVLLKRLEDALADGDTVHAVIAGSAVNNDGADKIGYTAPSIAGQAEVIAEAHALAGVSAETIGYVEAHGTGTPLGDPIEVAALTAAFRRTTPARGYCALGSVKSNIGHLDTAAGVIGLIKTVLAVRSGVIPPSLHFESPNPALALDASPFHVPSAATAWTVAGPRRAGVSSFGIGGTNAHLVVEEAPPRSPPGSTPRAAQLIGVSARTPDALAGACARLARAFDAGEAPLADAAFTLARGRRPFALRRAVVTATPADAAARLRRPDPGVPFRDARPVAWLFPGQGAQHLGMGEALANGEPAFRAALEEAAAALARHGLADVRDLMWPDDRGPEAAARLTRTEHAQAAIFAFEYALARLWQSWGVQPAVVLGHSVGELAAVVIAGVMSLEDAAGFVAARARLMQSLPAGAMLAVPCRADEAARWIRPGIWLCAVNAPESCVLGGALDDVAVLERELRHAGVETRRLQTSHAFHSGMVEPIVPDLRAAIARVTLRAPGIAWVSSMTGGRMDDAAAVDPEYWVRQAREPVDFAAAVGAVLAFPDHALIEVGPGDALTTLTRRRAAATRVVISACGPAAKDEAGALAHAVGTAWASGVPIDWARYYALETRHRVPLPGYPFERRRFWIDPPSGPASAASTPGPGTRMYAPTWRTAPIAGSRDCAGRWLLLADEHGVGEALAAQLSRAGAAVRVVPATECAVANAERLAQWLGEARPEHVVHLSSITGRGPFDPARMLERGYDSVLALAQALVRHARTVEGPLALTVVTDRVHAVTGQDVVRAEQALMLGPVRVLAQEHPGIRCRLVDLEVAHTSDLRVSQLLAECLVDGLVDGLADSLVDSVAEADDAVVALRGRQRWVQAFEEIPGPGSAGPALRRDGVYLVTGGFGALGQRLARHLQATVGARVVLTGRRSIPAPAASPSPLAADEDRVTLEIGDDVAVEIPDLPIGVDAFEIAATDAAVTAQRPIRPIAADPALARALDGYCVALIRECFEGAGVELAAGARHTTASLATRIGVIAPYRRFLDFMVDVLVGEGVLRRHDAGLVVSGHPRFASSDLHARAVAEFPDLAPVFDLLRACGASYPALLRGSIGGTGVLYPDGESGAVERAVAALAGRARHAAYAQVLARLLERTAEGAAGTFRVLEIGGGNRFLTREVVPALAGADVEYWFTDVSREFVDRAEAWAGTGGHGQVRARVLDISRDPGAQGWSERFDAVIGLDVVHATRDVEATLRHLQGLIAPGGSLHLIETLPPARWNTMVWGVAEQWWGYADRVRTTSPLLSVGQWTEVLAATGYDAVGAYPPDASDDCAIVFGLRPAEPALDDRVLAMQADVTDAARMAEVVARARERFGPINGVIHAAGLEAAGALALQHGHDAAGLAAKVRGTRVLEAVLRDEPLDFLVLCSSVTSLIGGVGNVEYAAANAFLDAFAHEPAARGYPVVSVNWDRWRGLGMAAAVEARHLARTGEAMQGGLPEDEALACFTAIAAAPRRAQVIVAPPGFAEARTAAARTDVTALAARIVAAAGHPRPYMATPFVAPRGDAEQQIAAVWGETLGVEEIGADDDFTELGGDSLIAIKVVARLRAALGLALDVAALFEHPTVARLARHVEALRWAAAPVPSLAGDVEEGEL